MNGEILWRQGVGISRYEWMLQRRAWGTWLAGLFLLAVVVSEHPAFSNGKGFSITEAANVWADRIIVMGSFVAMLTVPFALDRVRRQRVAPVEFSKPFEKLPYVLGKFMGAVLPLAVVSLLSFLIHIGISLATSENSSLLPTVGIYLHQAALIAIVPLLYAACLTYCLSVYISHPILIIPLYLFYLLITTMSQAAADAAFSWWSPMVRPDYFSYDIPSRWTSTITAHQILYLSLSTIALALALYGFQRIKFVNGKNASALWRRLRLPLPAQLSVRFRMLGGGHMVAALIMAVFALANTLNNPETNPFWQADYAMFGLEFYLSVSGLLILAGVVARDQGLGALDLVLSKPVNRWRLLKERLLPALACYSVLCVLEVFFLRLVYHQLPVLKALVVSLSTGIYLGIFGMTIANLTRSDLAGYGTGLIYWLFEAGFDGRFTAPFYLLIVSNQVDNPNLDLWGSPTIWLPVKVGLLFLSLWLFFFNGWLLDAGPGRRCALILLTISIPVIFGLGWWLIPMLV